MFKVRHSFKANQAFVFEVDGAVVCPESNFALTRLTAFELEQILARLTLPYLMILWLRHGLSKWHTSLDSQLSVFSWLSLDHHYQFPLQSLLHPKSRSIRTYRRVQFGHSICPG